MLINLWVRVCLHIICVGVSRNAVNAVRKLYDRDPTKKKDGANYKEVSKALQKGEIECMVRHQQEMALDDNTTDVNEKQCVLRHVITWAIFDAVIQCERCGGSLHENICRVERSG